MKRAYANRGVGHKRKPCERRAKRDDANREVQLPLDRDELLGLMQDSLESLAVELGLLIAAGLLEDEVARLCGARYQHQSDRTHKRYGRQGGVVTLGGQKLPIDRPRVREAGGGGEVTLENYQRLQSSDAMPQAGGARGAAAAVVPSTSTSPEVAGIRSETTRNSVDFPQPDGPSSVRNPPLGMVKLTRSSAVTTPRSVGKRTVTS